jgi:hypothetical protein
MGILVTTAPALMCCLRRVHPSAAAVVNVDIHKMLLTLLPALLPRLECGAQDPAEPPAGPRPAVWRAGHGGGHRA